MVSLGQEVLAPYCKVDSNGEPLFKPPGARGSRCLTWATRRARTWRAYRTPPRAVRDRDPSDRVYETDMAEGLKVMALEATVWRACHTAP